MPWATDRKPSPGLYEFKKVAEPVQAEAVDIERGIIRLVNRYDFSDLNRFCAVYTVMEDDVIIESKSLVLPSIPGRAAKEITIPYETIKKAKPGAEYYLNISFRLEEDGHMLRVKLRTINSTTNSAWHFKTTYSYVVCPTGDILIDWVSMTNDRGMGIVASTEGSFNFSASYYEDRDLDAAKHTCDLEKRDYIVFSVDYKQNALGSYSCGQWQMEKYRAKFEAYKMSFRITPFNNKEISDKAVAHERIKIQ